MYDYFKMKFKLSSVARILWKMLFQESENVCGESKKAKIENDGSHNTVNQIKNYEHITFHAQWCECFVLF